MGHDRRGLRLLGTLLAVLALGVGVGGCGSDDDGGATGSASGSGSGSEAEAEAGDEDLRAYCDAVFAIETVPEPDFDFESMSEDEQKAEAKRFASEKLLPLTDDIQAATPSEIEDDIATLVGAVEDIAETGDFGVFETDEVEAASDRTHGFDTEHCGWNVVEVAASEYRFEGVAAEYEAGETSFDFTNKGKELHEFVLLKKKADTKESFDELLDLPEEEARTKVDQVGAIFGEPGDDDYVVTDLEPGEYLALCFVPTGLTPAAAAEAEKRGTEPEGPPHFTQGMRAQFTVG